MASHLVVSPSASARLDAAGAWLAGAATKGEVLVVGASRAAADELAARVALARGGLFGVSRAGFHELVTRLALPALAKAGLSPTGGLGAEAVVTRAAFEAAEAGELRYFAPVAKLPGFPRAVSRTLTELQMASVAGDRLGGLDAAGGDLAALLHRVAGATSRSGTATRADVLRAAEAALVNGTHALGRPHIVLLDVPVTSDAESQVLAALANVAASVFAAVPGGDARGHPARGG